MPQVALDPETAWQDPASVLSDSLALDPVAALARASTAETVSAEPVSENPEDGQTGRTALSALSPADPDWLAGWRAADEQAAEAINGALADDEQLSEPAVTAELGVLLPAEATLFVASSMPVRDIETFWPVRADPPRCWQPRGERNRRNGVQRIRGHCLHGWSGRAADRRCGAGTRHRRIARRPPPWIEADDRAARQRRWGASSTSCRSRARRWRGRTTSTPTTSRPPTGLDFAKAAALYGLGYEPVETIPALRAALERALSPEVGSTIVRARTDRAGNVALHGRVWSAVPQRSAGQERQQRLQLDLRLGQLGLWTGVAHDSVACVAARDVAAQECTA